MAAKLFFSYASADERFKKQLEAHLSVLRRMGAVEPWSFREIAPGDEWRGEIDRNLVAAQIILLLISADFMNSDYCYDVEMKHALARRRAGDTAVIPIIVRDCDWKIGKLATLQALPRDGKPITRWRDRDSAWKDVVQGIREVIANFMSAAPTTVGRSSATEPRPSRLNLAALKVPSIAFFPGEHLDKDRYAIVFKARVANRIVSIVVSGEALQDHFGATTETDLRSAFRKHREKIQDRVVALLRAKWITGLRDLHLGSNDFGQVRIRDVSGAWDTYATLIDSSGVRVDDRDVVQLKQRGRTVTGTSNHAPGVQYAVKGSLDEGNLVSGVWHSIMHPTHGGTFQLMIAPDGQQMSGRWLGMWMGSIQVGEWTWRRKETTAV